LTGIAISHRKHDRNRIVFIGLKWQYLRAMGWSILKNLAVCEALPNGRI